MWTNYIQLNISYCNNIWVLFLLTWQVVVTEPYVTEALLFSVVSLVVIRISVIIFSNKFSYSLFKKSQPQHSKIVDL